MKILLACDGSQPALNAVSTATHLFQQLRVPSAHSITLINVHDDVGLRHAKAMVGKGAVADYLREISEEELKSARALLDAAGVKHDMEIRTGHVAQEIVHCADEGSFDLIVLGAKGRGAVADLLLGSVAQRVLAMAKVPVMLVK
jgi:nucleotide-binding universal stress UspA family protein